MCDSFGMPSAAKRAKKARLSFSMHNEIHFLRFDLLLLKENFQRPAGKPSICLCRMRMPFDSSRFSVEMMRTHDHQTNSVDQHRFSPFLRIYRNSNSCTYKSTLAANPFCHSIVYRWLVQFSPALGCIVPFQIVTDSRIVFRLCLRLIFI